jgi:hypothetical protein
LAAIGIIPIVSAKKVKDINNDLDPTTNTFKSYDKGDKIVITGKIISIIEPKYLLSDDLETSENSLIEKFGGKYIYILDDNLEVYSNNKIGKKGDEVIIECIVQERNNNGREEEILQANPSFNPISFIIVGSALLIISSTIVFFIIRKRRSILRAASTPHKVAKFYETKKSVDEETTMYQFLHSKQPAQAPTKNENIVEGKATIIKQKPLRIHIPPTLDTQLPRINAQPLTTGIKKPDLYSSKPLHPRLVKKSRISIDYNSLKRYYQTLESLEQEEESTSTQSRSVIATPVQAPPSTNVSIQAPPALATPVQTQSANKVPIHAQPKLATPVQPTPAAKAPVQAQSSTSSLVQSQPAIKIPFQSKPPTDTPMDLDQNALKEYYKKL